MGTCSTNSVRTFYHNIKRRRPKKKLKKRKMVGRRKRMRRKIKKIKRILVVMKMIQLRKQKKIKRKKKKDKKKDSSFEDGATDMENLSVDDATLLKVLRSFLLTIQTLMSMPLWKQLLMNKWLLD